MRFRPAHDTAGMTTPKIFVILGMHRSATSLIAKALHAAGVDMGRHLLEPGPGNPDGHYECLDALAINETILTDAGGTWDHPPSPQRIEATGCDDRIAAYIDQRNATAATWGFKDPRTVLTWPVWRRNLTGDVHVIVVWRDPAEIARSLHDRDGTPADEAHRLALEYHDRMRRL